MKVLLLTPPMIQLNAPYPATPYLKGFLESHGHTAVQDDFSLKLFLKLFSKDGLERIRKKIKPETEATQFFVDHFERYVSTIDGVVRFLQGKEPTLAYRIAQTDYLPRGPRFHFNELDEPIQWAFGTLGTQDQAKFLASLYIDDLADVIQQGIDSHFTLTKYAQSLSASQPSFEPILQSLKKQKSLIDTLLKELTEEALQKHKPDVVAVTAPFPGNVFSAFRVAEFAKSKSPKTITVFGGGYANTELRNLKDARVADFFDYIVLDDGEAPLLTLLEHLEGKREKKELQRTYFRDGDKLHYQLNPAVRDISHKDLPTPSFAGLPLDSYVSLLEMLNPMHRIWSDGRWNKISIAHGCYWKQCSFCDVTLDYISRYDPASAKTILERMSKISEETQQTGFHFIDEAAPPALLKNLSQEIVKAGVTFTWWGNIRFEKSFTPELCSLMADAGCIAVSGGLEVASDRLLKLMKKGVTVEQVARVTKAFTDSGILVHAYLMYGFPSQTVQETVDTLERVRQLFLHGCIQSAFWHRFSATVHSPIGKDPKQYGIKLKTRKKTEFSENDLEFTDPTGTDHDALGHGLRRALYNYMHGIGLDEDVRTWFQEIKRPPKTTVAANFIANALKS